MKKGKDIFSYRKNTVDEWVIEEVYERNIYLKDFIFQFIPENGIVVDIGAHIGCFTILAAKKLMPRVIVAIEPELSNFTYLVQNINSSGLREMVKPVHAALSNKIGSGRLYIDNWNTGGASFFPEKLRQEGADISTLNPIEIPLTTLDMLLQELGFENEKIKVLKIDAEGAEALILEGAVKALERTAVIVGEIHEALVPKEKIILLLKDFAVVFGESFSPINCRNFWAVRKDLVSSEEEKEILKQAYITSLEDLVWRFRKEISDLQNQLSERTQWAIGLNQDIQKRDEHIKKLDEELKEKGDYIRKLQGEIDERNRHIKKLDAALLEKENYIKKLQMENEDKGKIINLARRKFEDKNIILDAGSYHGVMDVIKYIKNEINPFSEFELLIRPVDIEKYRNNPLFSRIHIVPQGNSNRLRLLFELRRNKYKRAFVVIDSSPARNKFRVFGSLLGTSEMYIWDGKKPIYRVGKILSIFTSLSSVPISGLAVLPILMKKVFEFAALPFKFLYLLFYYFITSIRK